MTEHEHWPQAFNRKCPKCGEITLEIVRHKDTGVLWDVCGQCKYAAVLMDGPTA